MRDISIAAVQFEHADGNKKANLARIRDLTLQASEAGAEIVSFHECCIPGYSFAQSLSRDKLFDLAERVPDGPSLATLVEISRDAGIPVLAGLFERMDDKVFNTYVCVSSEGLVARFRKLHAFISPFISSGEDYCVFELLGCQFGILICYDNNLPENVRVTSLRGAEIIFMPHVTGCLPSVMPGRGTVDPQLWLNRKSNPVRLRQELNGPKGREWLMRWLPTRAYENGIYAVFTNPIGFDGGQIRNGNAMILDPYGEILCECHELGDDFAVGLCTASKRDHASGQRYLRARRPELYADLTKGGSEPPRTEPGWSLMPPPSSEGSDD